MTIERKEVETKKNTNNFELKVEMVRLFGMREAGVKKYTGWGWSIVTSRLCSRSIIALNLKIPTLWPFISNYLFLAEAITKGISHSSSRNFENETVNKNLCLLANDGP